MILYNLLLLFTCTQLPDHAVTTKATLNSTPLPGLLSILVLSCHFLLWRFSSRLDLQRYWLCASFSSYWEISIGKTDQFQSLWMLSLFHAVSPGVHCEPWEHRSAEPFHLTSESHQLLHWADIPRGQQLQPPAVSKALKKWENYNYTLFVHRYSIKFYQSIILLIFTVNICNNNCCSSRLPLLCRCVAPAVAFTQLTPQQSMIVLSNLTTLCSDLDTQVPTHSTTSTKPGLQKPCSWMLLPFAV